jgi:UDP-N-acetylglucosamine 2-epimerase (non-hydrolysing)/GDP/UDP-N,N'-diacetylbacillosamine 2-epimerase (hydrolysing)
MPRKDYIKLMKSVDFIVGNSSAGIIEAPLAGVPAINVGNRQQGRLMARSIINQPIPEAIKIVYSNEFQDMIRSNYEVYYTGYKTAEMMSIYIDSYIPLIGVKKHFHDKSCHNT